VILPTDRYRELSRKKKGYWWWKVQCVCFDNQDQQNNRGQSIG